MLRIGQAARQFDISRRTLRYWEEEGILTSERTENGYRVYDEENALRIRQIVLLRGLRMPIAQIEAIYQAGQVSAAIDALTRHLETIKLERKSLDDLSALLDGLIARLRAQESLDGVFACLESKENSLSILRMPPPQIPLSGRNVQMTEIALSNVRIVKLPRMTVASYLATSETPEDDCSRVMDPFVFQNKLHEWSGFRHFGFNNPSPVEGNPVYGYEMWVTIPDDFAVPVPLTKKVFEGGLYASIPTAMSEIGERWQQLHRWVEQSEQYAVDMSFQWLEECTDFVHFTTPGAPDKQLDLLEPIRRK